MTIQEVQRALSPSPFALVTSLKEDGRTNLMALSWWTFVSNHPPMLAIATSDRGCTGRCIRRTGEFGLCLAEEGLEEKALQCGTCSGGSCDKAALTGIELMDADCIGPKLVKASPIALECRLTDTLAAGDHTIYLAEVVQIHPNPEAGAPLYAWEGYKRLGPVRP